MQQILSRRQVQQIREYFQAAAQHHPVDAHQANQIQHWGQRRDYEHQNDVLDNY